ncbi:MAG: hypothetical protein ACRBB0_13190 [Pelagimonas sp.]|uniref:hypothetical protein n=1 Tax=Pelagimonas sp. TaxID=2073170 RepID=UPI003D6ABFF8
MLEYNGFDETWRLLVQGTKPGGGGPGVKGAAVYFDGRLADRQVHFGFDGEDGTSQSHAKLDLIPSDLQSVVKGSTIQIEINGETSRSWNLNGSTAATLKVSECATQFGFTPKTTPNSRKATSASPGPESATVDGYNVGYVVYQGGVFRVLNGDRWVEEKPDGTQLSFQVYDRNNESVFLNDASRNLQIWLNLPAYQIYLTKGFDNQSWSFLYSIDCFDTHASRAC